MAATTPLIAAAHNVAFRPLDGRAFERLRKIARALDTSIRDLRRTARRLGAKWN